MGRTVQPAAKGVDAIISIGNTVLAGQKNVILNRQVRMINVTNEIEKNWAESLPATKSWTVNCGGMFIKNEAAFTALENAFLNGTLLTIELIGNGKTYTGSAYLSQFPLTASYNDTFTYNLTFIGSGELTIEN